LFVIAVGDDSSKADVDDDDNVDDEAKLFRSNSIVGGRFESGVESADFDPKGSPVARFVCAKLVDRLNSEGGGGTTSNSFGRDRIDDPIEFVDVAVVPDPTVAADDATDADEELMIVRRRNCADTGN
jgi:hypothetical protein